MPSHVAHALPFSQQETDALNDCLKGIKRLLKRHRGGQPTLRCFISYAEYNPLQGEANLHLQTWLYQLRDHLQQAGIFAQLNVMPSSGEPLEGDRSVGIQQSDVVLVIGTPQLKERLTQGSNHVSFELGCARQKAKINPQTVQCIWQTGITLEEAFPDDLYSYPVHDFRQADTYPHVLLGIDTRGLIPTLYGLTASHPAQAEYTHLIQGYTTQIETIRSLQAQENQQLAACQCG